MTKFIIVDIEHVQCEQNARVDVLAKLASMRRPENNKSIIQEMLAGPSVEAIFIMVIDDPSLFWIDLILKVLRSETDASNISKNLMREVSHYTLVAGQVYRRSFTHPMLVCVPKS